MEKLLRQAKYYFDQNWVWYNPDVFEVILQEARSENEEFDKKALEEKTIRLQKIKTTLTSELKLLIEIEEKLPRFFDLIQRFHYKFNIFSMAERDLNAYSERIQALKSERDSLCKWPFFNKPINIRRNSRIQRDIGDYAWFCAEESDVIWELKQEIESCKQEMINILAEMKISSLNDGVVKSMLSRFFIIDLREYDYLWFDNLLRKIGKEITILKNKIEVFTLIEKELKNNGNTNLSLEELFLQFSEKVHTWLRTSNKDSNNTGNFWQDPDNRPETIGNNL